LKHATGSDTTCGNKRFREDCESAEAETRRHERAGRWARHIATLTCGFAVPTKRPARDWIQAARVREVRDVTASVDTAHSFAK
jgi:hypothetical protein